MTFYCCPLRGLPLGARKGEKKWKCALSSCEVEVDDPQVVYECGSCGTQFTREESNSGNNQCPDCNKFSSKLYESGCPDCHEEVEDVERYFCEPCDESFETEEEANEHEKTHEKTEEEANEALAEVVKEKEG